MDICRYQMPSGVSSVWRRNNGNTRVCGAARCAGAASCAPGATAGFATGATAAIEGTLGGSIKAVYSRTRRPRDQLNSTSTLIKGSLTDLVDVIFT